MASPVTVGACVGAVASRYRPLVTPSIVASTTEEPAATAVTTPVELTVIADPAVADMDHVTVRPAIQFPALSRGVAYRVMELPTAIEGDGAVMSTEATRGVAAVVVVVVVVVTVASTTLIANVD